jgi:hypothetical protein
VEPLREFLLQMVIGGIVKKIKKILELEVPFI